MAVLTGWNYKRFYCLVFQNVVIGHINGYHLTGVVYKEMYSPRKKVAIITRWPCYWGSHKAGFHCTKEGWRLYKLLKIHSCNYFHPFLWQSEKTANIWPGHNWFPGKMTSGKWGQKFHSGDLSLPRSGY